MDELARVTGLEDLKAMEPRSTVSMRFGRDRGLQQLVVAIDVSCAETHNPRTLMVDALRALAMDIEAGVA